jgi:acyl-CoA hydrolase
MVAMNEHGKPTRVPALQPSTEEEKRRWAAALMRKQLRQEAEQRYTELMATLKV